MFAHKWATVIGPLINSWKWPDIARHAFKIVVFTDEQLEKAIDDSVATFTWYDTFNLKRSREMPLNIWHTKKRPASSFTNWIWQEHDISLFSFCEASAFGKNTAVWLLFVLLEV